MNGLDHARRAERLLRRPINGLLTAILAAGLACPGCGPSTGTAVIDQPITVLESTGEPMRVYLAAMSALDATPSDPAYLETLHRMVWRPGYLPAIREAAVDRLADRDPEGLARTLRQRLPQMTAWAGLTRLCEIIAERGWTHLTPALVSSWARANPLVPEETDRPEYKALAALLGPTHVTDAVFDLLVESKRPSQQGLRSRCWNLMQRIGARDRLARLLDQTDTADDGFLADLQAAHRDFGIIPVTREEVLWIRKLRDPEHRGFWSEATAAARGLSPARRAALEIRDVPVLVAAARHDPDLLDRDTAAMQAALEATLKDRKHYSHGSNYDSYSSAQDDRIHEWRGRLTWGDLAALHMALRALGVPQVVDHLLDYARRDQEDRSTEYGGVIALDDRGRFEVLEFPPRIREHDEKFIASQAMLDAAYPALFHFHFHVQRDRNEAYAGPGFGDVNYADNTRANCLVLTFVGEGRLNVDYYRHGRVLVDLGTIQSAP